MMRPTTSKRIRWKGLHMPTRFPRQYKVHFRCLVDLGSGDKNVKGQLYDWDIVLVSSADSENFPNDKYIG